MAPYFVRWCKTRLKNGYRSFPSLMNSKVSDTEELLVQEEPCQKQGSEKCCTSSTSPFPRPSHEATTATPNTGRRSKDGISVEKFEYDVSVMGCDSGKERKEFSFTLYDFDGHRKITEDDIAGLVRSIYEAVGNSVRLPHQGSKTIQVKLTVSPDRPPSPSSPTPCEKNTPCPGHHHHHPRVPPTHSHRAGEKPTHSRLHSVKVTHRASGKAQCRDCEDEEFPAPTRLRYCHVRCARTRLYGKGESWEGEEKLLGLGLSVPVVRLGCDDEDCRRRCRCNTRHGQECCVESSGCCKSSPRPRHSHHHHHQHHHHHRLKSEQELVKDLFGYQRLCRPKAAPGFSSSPHNHKNRREERERAMRQVLTWLEKQQLGQEDDDEEEDAVIVEKHEHHHVHEHVHHHYHHHLGGDDSLIIV
ncbi:unnamed protein product [Darwinula stevensoni]|uniref:Protein naked cuticle homolog n=1 Tax=Darwinula stevensoni TaxID=69355 RepID=A0A7R8X1F8_9CRUS|nr:unnamed protein product [Darwinula stevensoni]CAG0880216.1 unnamed protein product [Darwinula stevensoni]